MSKSFIFSSLKPLLAAAVIATGAVVGLSAVAPANALTIGTSSTSVTNFAQNEWVHLIYSDPKLPDPIAGVIIFNKLVGDTATLRIRIDNKFSSALSGFSFNVTSGNGNLTANNLSFIGGVNNFTSASGNGSGKVSISASTALAPTKFDEFLLTLNRTGIGANGGLSLSGLQFFTGGEDAQPIRGTFSAVPTPALLPGLIGLGIGALRKKRKQEEAVEVEADA